VRTRRRPDERGDPADEPAPHGIAVNAVAPGAIRAPGDRRGDEGALDAFAALVAIGRIGMVDDVAGTVAFMASGLASHGSGARLVVDGGRRPS
jgi:NAD(P)-dependent dehydrogenase (short-subunit alcohol dehydrogenase family)